MPYIPPQLQIDTESQNRRDKNIMGALESWGKVEDARKAALKLEQDKKDKQNIEANDFASKGVTGEEIAEAQKSGDYTKVRNRLAENFKSKAETDRIAAGVTNDLRKSQIAENNRQANTPKMSDQQKIDYQESLRREGEDRKMINDQQSKISDKNITLVNVKNAMDSALKQLEDPKLSEDEKVKVGQGLYKLLNSAEGADAVGAEEAKRVGSYLEYHIGNVTQPGAFIGRDLNGYTKQIKNYSGLLGERVKANEQTAQGLKQGKTFTQMVEPQKQQKPKTIIQGGFTYTLNEATGEYE